jgi:hypothetical protein
MNQHRARHKFSVIFILLSLNLGVHFLIPHDAHAAYPLLKKLIIDYNSRALENSLLDNSYRGEEGLLRIRPEIGKSLGMKVFMDQDYLDSKALFEEADRALEKVERAMVSQKRERLPGEYAQEIADHFLLHKNALESAGRKVMAYRSRLKSTDDERLNDLLCVKIMDRLLTECLRRAYHNLRDALGYFYNICQGVYENGAPLTPENVGFVNEVFNRFTAEASGDTLKEFDLDRHEDHKNRGTSDNWKSALDNEASKFVPFLETTLNTSNSDIFSIDPLLFMALMRRESNFDPMAVSSVGAAGLTQIMPKTGKTLGMTNIYIPQYFERAVSIAVSERRTREEAMGLLSQINEKNKIQIATQARKLMQEAIHLAEDKERLFAQYRQELLKEGTDDRLNPAEAIKHGIKYFTALMTQQKGDISLALASYNAGPNRVKQYGGIPPFAETVLFRNAVLKYYREYLARLEGNL